VICRTFPLVGLALLAGLAACTSPVDDWQPLEAPKTNTVALSRLTHTVQFAPGATRISAAERHRLAGFIADADLMAGEHVYLETPRGDAVSRAREDDIRRILARRGILVGSIPASMTAPDSQIALGDTVTIQLERYVVTPPDCPNWSKPTGGDPTNSVASNFGCATATNLGLMVANPRDLIAGRTPGPVDAEPTLIAVQNYRAGKPIALPDDLSGNSAPGASAGTAGAIGAAAGATAGAAGAGAASAGSGG
jgi:pilus assembly protein CpaD